MVNDSDVLEGRPYKELLDLYKENFSLGYLNTDINNKKNSTELSNLEDVINVEMNSEYDIS